MNVRDYLNMDIIEKIVEGTEAFPQKILGPHETETGYVVTVYHPSAKKIQLQRNSEDIIYDMEKVHENGMFSVFIPSKEYKEYKLMYYFDGDTPYVVEDAYAFPSFITQNDCYMFGNGCHYEIYEKLGAHPMSLNGIEGTYFAVWAPHAKRVSVVGDFNMWDGRIHMMRRRGDFGIFELFVPGVKSGVVYKYEIITSQGDRILKSDPFANEFEVRPNNASVVADLRGFQWSDNDWMQQRESENLDKKPVNIYEVHIGSWKKPMPEDGIEFYDYRRMAHELAEYVKYMGYTHVELMGISEHPYDGSWGYQVTGYFAPTSRYGSPADFQYMVNYLHEQGIGVILDWVPAHFPKDGFALGRFDGEPLFEHPDKRRGEHPDWGTYIFNYGKKEVSNFLIGSALFWLEKFHVDGLRTDAVASMLYLDYGKQDGQWLPNKYGGKENLEAVDFLRHLNSIVDKREKGCIMIAEESTAWPKVTAKAEDGGLGFHYKWNMGWMNDFLEYVSMNPLFRKGNHNKMTFAMSYYYAERYILVLSHDEVVHGKCSMINKMPGNEEEKFAGLRTSYAFMFGHPGKNLLFMGQEFAQKLEWSEERSIDWYLLDEPKHRGMHDWVRKLLHMTQEYPALYETDYADGFEWISCNDAEKSVYSFVRKAPADQKEHSLVFVYNFTPVVWNDFRVGVPWEGTYKAVLNSDDISYGGNGEFINGFVAAEEKPWDNRPYSIPVALPPLGSVVFEYMGSGSTEELKQDIHEEKKESNQIEEKEETGKEESPEERKESNQVEEKEDALAKAEAQTKKDSVKKSVSKKKNRKARRKSGNRR